jgi:hypothetical protein
LPHWKVRSLVGCRHCFQSSVELMQVLSERYSIDGAALETQRRRKAAAKAAAAAAAASGDNSSAAKLRRPVAIETPATPPSQLTIALSNSLFSLLLTPLWSLPNNSLTSGNPAANPLATDALNVMGKVIVQPHIWPAIIACLQSKVPSTSTTGKHGNGRRRSSIGLTAAATDSSSSSQAHHRSQGLLGPQPPYLVHHVLKDLNTLFIGSNVASNRRNCALLFKFFAASARRDAQRRAEEIAAEEHERKLSDKERERLERRRRKYGDERLRQRPAIGAWQAGLLELLRAHVPASSSSSSSTASTSSSVSLRHASEAERLHSKIFQYALNLFGVLHFYKFQCIAGGTKEANIHVNPGPGTSSSANQQQQQSASSLEFERMFKESFWRAMHMDDGVLAARKELSAKAAAKAAAVAAGKPLSPVAEKSSSSSSRRRSSLFKHIDPHAPLVSHTVARALLTTMLQRLIFKIRSKTLALDGRYQAVAFVLALVKSFVFHMPLKHAMAGALPPGTEAPSATTSGLTPEQLLGFELDFPSNTESLHRGAGTGTAGAPSASSELHDDLELLDKALELLRALRLCSDSASGSGASGGGGGGAILDVESLPLSKQRELRAHVEALASANARQGTTKRLTEKSNTELHVDALSKLRLSTAHDDLLRLYARSLPADQTALRFLQAHVSFFKDASVFVSILSAHLCGAPIARRRAPSMEQKELQNLVAQFVSMERREKVFCSK